MAAACASGLSLFFYGYWDWRFVPLLAGSIVVNWLVANAFVRSGLSILIPLAIAANLLVLAIFKYFNFFADLAAYIPGLPTRHFDIALPLGISFFTFHHIMYLTDLKKGKAPLTISSATVSTSPSSRRFSQARSCAGARSCTSSRSGLIGGPMPPSASRGG